MESFESKDDDGKDKKLSLSFWEFFWKGSLVPGYGSGSVAKFLKNLPLFSYLSKYEISVISKYLHHRVFDEQEIIFENNSNGIGFYIIYRGSVEIDKEENKPDDVIILHSNKYFGELALFQEGHTRMATARAGRGCELLCIFKPDLEKFIEIHPQVAAKFILALSREIAIRLRSLVEYSRSD